MARPMPRPAPVTRTVGVLMRRTLAQTGLQASGLFGNLAGPVVNHAECTAYGQGGSRVTDPIGPWNAAMLALPTADAQFMGQLGQLTSPVADQIARHLAAHGGSFNGKELVTVLAGANDVFVQADAVVLVVQAAATQAATAAAQSGATQEQVASQNSALEPPCTQVCRHAG